MYRKRRSIIWKLPRQNLIDLLDKSETFTEVLAHFNLRNIGGNFRTLTNRLKEEGIKYDKFKKNAGKFRRRIKNLSEVMIKNSSFGRKNLKVRIIREKILPYICAICNQEPKWKDKELVLILDHINGIWNDHRKENLRFLCPNCNSQTETFCGKKNKQL